MTHPAPIGIEGIDDDGIEEAAVGLVEGIQETVGGREFAFVAGVLAHRIGARLLIEYRFNGQNHIHHRP